MDTKVIVSTVQNLSPSRKELTVEIPAEDAAKEYGLAVERFASQVKMPGFRPGRVPLEIVRRRFSDEIEHSLIDGLAPEALQASFREHGLEPVGIPLLRDIEFKENQPLRFKAEIEVWPEFDLPDHTKVKIARKEIRVDEEDVELYLEQLRQRSSEYVPVQGRGVVGGDYVALETQCLDREANKKFAVEKSVLLAGPSEDNPLSEKIMGLAEGEEGRFEISYPAEHPDKRLSGKTISFRVKILAVKEKKVPALDDDLAKTLGEFENLTSLRERVRDDLLKSKTKAFRNEAAREILDKLVEQVPDDLPRTLLEQETQDLLRKFLQSPGAQGFPAGGREALEDIKKRLRSQAERTIKNHLVLKKVAAAQGLKVSEADIEEEIKELALSNRVQPARLRAHLENEGRMDSLRESLLFRQAVDFLVDQAIMSC